MKKLEEELKSLSDGHNNLFKQVTKQMEKMCQQFFGRNFNEIGEGFGVKMGGRFSKGGTSSTNFLPRTLKLNFPQYDGRDVTWMSRAEKYFLLHDIAKLNKVALSSFYLEGDAQLWFQTLE